MSFVRTILRTASDPWHTKWICPLLLLGDTILTSLVIWKIPYTKIDWDAYMQQVEIYLHGERDYVKIVGETGPLVYPAMHVYIYRGLYAITDSGRDIVTAQYIFAALYLATLALVMLCYRQARVPPYVFPMLVLSKRLHSIFVLRLFNDCFAVAFLFLMIYCYQKRLWTVGTLLYSLGLGVKMSVLLALPAIGAVLWQGMGRDRAFFQGQSIGQFQFILGIPFISHNARSYLTRAFEFTRQFLFKWTVNWRFVGEEWFLSRPFSLGLVGTHLTLLYTFMLSRWLKPADLSLPEAIEQFFTPPPKEVENKISRKVTPDFIITAILSAIIIGCLCARSLHYQFYAYIAWSTPFLLWRSRMNPVLMYIIWAAQEWSWNVYPSTDASSMVAVGCMTITVAGVWIGTSSFIDVKTNETKHEHAE